MTIDYKVQGAAPKTKEPAEALENLRRFEEAMKVVEKYPSPGKWAWLEPRTIWEYVSGNKEKS